MKLPLAFIGVGNERHDGDLQRQSAEWASKCCGLDIGRLVKAIDDAAERRKIRKTREQIEQELAFLEAARAAAAVVK